MEKVGHRSKGYDWSSATNRECSRKMWKRWVIGQKVTTGAVLPTESVRGRCGKGGSKVKRL